MLQIQLDKQFYFPTEIVEGKLTLKLTEPAIIRDLKLYITKEQKVLLKLMNNEETNVIVDKKNTEKESVHSLCANYELGPGLHTFPFKFILKYNENGTGGSKGYFDDSVCYIENFFLIRAGCITSGPEYKIEKKVIIFDRNEEKTQTDVKIKKSSLTCLFDKKTAYRIQTDKLWYFRGDNVVVDLFPLSNSKKKIVTGVNVKMYQIMTIKDKNEEIVKSRRVADLEESLSNKNRFRIHFRIPMNAGPTITEKEFSVKTLLVFDLKLYNGRLMKVRKFLNVGEAMFEVPSVEESSYNDGTTFREFYVHY